jgi:phosphocarrier protein HPr
MTGSRPSAKIRRQFEIKNRLGLHARAAALFVQTASRFKSALTVTKDGEAVDGKSIIGLMMLAAACGSTIEVEAEGPDAEAAVAAIEALIEGKFNEE